MRKQTSKKQNFNHLSKEEYLLSNGIGGVVAGTKSGANTSRHHGLLIADVATSKKKFVSKIEESIFVTRDCCIGLSSNQYPNTIYPQGHQYIQNFKLTPFPTWEYQVGDARLKKSIKMVQDTNTSIVQYENIGKGCYQLNLNPLFVYRDYDQLFHENKQFDFHFNKAGNQLQIYAKYGATPFYFYFSKGAFKENRNWFKNFQYEKDKTEGLDYQEDAYSIGEIQIILCAEESINLIFSVEKKGTVGLLNE